MKKVLLSGIQPSGEMHIGNYFGAIKQFVDLQNEYESYVFIADLHALTTTQDASKLKQSIFEVAATYIACGLDPKKVCLFQQSAIGGEVSELTWIFNCITTVPYLERGVAYKDKVANGKEATVGLFDYPILMAADILIQDADIVPVGADQKQHLEYARDTVEKFNRTWSKVFKMPEPLILADTGVVPGLDGKKMSKSYGNTIPLFATDEEIKKLVMSIVTDSGGDRPEHVYAIHKLFKTEAELAPLYDSNKGKYKILKESLAEDIIAYVTPMRTKYIELMNNKKEIQKILDESAKVVKERAVSKMKKVKGVVGLN